MAAAGWGVLRGRAEAKQVTALVVHTPSELTAAGEKNSAHRRAMILLRAAARLALLVCQFGPAHAAWWQTPVDASERTTFLPYAPHLVSWLARGSLPVPVDELLPAIVREWLRPQHEATQLQGELSLKRAYRDPVLFGSDRA